MATSKITTSRLLEMKQKGRKIVALTAYDAPTASLLNAAGVDVILVGDSVGNVKLGYENTLPVTVDEMLHHTKAVARANTHCLLVADMPYLSYEIDALEAVRNAGRLIKEGGAEAVKVEGGIEIAPMIKELLRVNIPVMGHLGLTPQSILQFGGYGLQASSIEEAQRLLSDAIALEEAGAFALVLEKIPSELAELVTASLEIPTIGIGAGPACDGQVLVVNDMLGMFEKFVPKFVKQYANLRAIIDQAAKDYINDVRGDVFPAGEQTFHMDKETLGNFMEEIDRGLGRK